MRQHMGRWLRVEVAKWQSGKVSGFCHLDFATSFFEGVIPCRADTL